MCNLNHILMFKTLKSSSVILMYSDTIMFIGTDEIL